MLKKISSSLILFLLTFSFIQAEDITGFWMTLNKKTKKPSSVIALYPYEGQYYGRIIATYDENGIMDDTIYHPKDKAPGIAGHPYYSGLDIIWTTTTSNSGKYKGFVVDPTEGKTYSAKLWKDGNNVVLRGEVFIFGKNTAWPPFPESGFTKDFPKPDLTTFTPTIPKTI